MVKHFLDAVYILFLKIRNTFLVKFHFFYKSVSIFQIIHLFEDPTLPFFPLPKSSPSHYESPPLYKGELGGSSHWAKMMLQFPSRNIVKLTWIFCKQSRRGSREFHMSEQNTILFGAERSVLTEHLDAMFPRTLIKISDFTNKFSPSVKPLGNWFDTFVDRRLHCTIWATKHTRMSRCTYSTRRLYTA